ncbi:MAG: class I SAM-dependent methyltransferase [Candidatus Puniceispirillaceae bacterium]
MIRRIQPFAQKLLDKYFMATQTTGNVGDADFHVDMIVHLASVLRPKTYVELGTNRCETFNRVSQFAGTAYGADIWAESQSYMKNKSCFFHGSTSDFSDHLRAKDVKIDLLFIDADHSAKSVKEDFENFFDMMTDDGVILMHDGYPKDASQLSPDICGDGYKAIKELSKERDYFELVTIPFPPGLSICRVRQKQVPWEG